MVRPVGTRRGTPGSSVDVFHRAQVHAGVFLGPVGVRRQDGVGVDALDSNLHSPLS